MRAILVAMAIAARSFAEAAKLAGIAAELKISPRHLQTLCQEQGGIGVDEQTERTTAYKDRPLMTPTTAANPPIELAAVMIDGGRIQVRTRPRAGGPRAGLEGDQDGRPAADEASGIRRRSTAEPPHVLCWTSGIGCRAATGE